MKEIENHLEGRWRGPRRTPEWNLHWKIRTGVSTIEGMVSGKTEKQNQIVAIFWRLFFPANHRGVLSSMCLFILRVWQETWFFGTICYTIVQKTASGTLQEPKCQLELYNPQLSPPYRQTDISTHKQDKQETIDVCVMVRVVVWLGHSNRSG